MCAFVFWLESGSVADCNAFGAGPEPERILTSTSPFHVFTLARCVFTRPPSPPQFFTPPESSADCCAIEAEMQCIEADGCFWVEQECREEALPDVDCGGGWGGGSGAGNDCCAIDAQRPCEASDGCIWAREDNECRDADSPEVRSTAVPA